MPPALDRLFDSAYLVTLGETTLRVVFTLALAVGVLLVLAARLWSRRLVGRVDGDP